VENPNIQRFELCPKYNTPELKQAVDQIQADINSGKITLPDGV
jgi:hypothetical protein